MRKKYEHDERIKIIAIVEMRNILKKWDEWLRHCLRLRIWNEWKLPTIQDGWKVAGDPVLTCTITNKVLLEAGYHSMLENLNI